MNMLAPELEREKSRSRRGARTGIVLTLENQRRRLTSVTALRGDHFSKRQSKAIGEKVPLVDKSRVENLEDTPLYVVEVDVQSTVIRLIVDSVRAYRGPDGFEGDILEAVDQIERLGAKAWPTLSMIAAVPFPELEYFLGSIVHISGVSSEDRIVALLSATRNDSPNVRSRLLELADELPDQDCLRLIKGIASSDFDDDVTDRALEKLQDLVA